MYNETLDLDTARIRNELYNSPDFTTLTASGFESVLESLYFSEGEQPVMFEAGKENGSLQEITKYGTFIFKDVNGKNFEISKSYSSDNNFKYRYDLEDSLGWKPVYEVDANDKRVKINASDVHKTLADMVSSEYFVEAATISYKNHLYEAKEDLFEDLQRTFNDMESDILVFDNDFVVMREPDGSVLFDDDFDLEEELDKYVHNYFYSNKEPVHPFIHTSLVNHVDDALYKEARSHSDEICIKTVDHLYETIKKEQEEIHKLKEEAKEKNVSFSDKTQENEKDLSELMEHVDSQLSPVIQSQGKDKEERKNIFAQWAHDVHEANKDLSSGLKDGLHLLGVSLKDKFKSALSTVKEDMKFIYYDVKEEQSMRKAKRYSNHLYHKEKLVDWLAPGLRDTVKSQSQEIEDLKAQLAEIKVGRANAQDDTIKKKART